MQNKPNIQKISIRDVKFGKDVTVIEPVNLYSCQIGDKCFVGPFTEIQRGVKIGAETRIQSHVCICELVSIGIHCFISNGVMFINDPFAKGGAAFHDHSTWKFTSIGNNVSIGANATIMPVKICDHVVIGAGSVVTKDITESGIYAGNPARKLRNLRNF